MSQIKIFRLSCYFRNPCGQHEYHFGITPQTQFYKGIWFMNWKLWLLQGISKVSNLHWLIKKGDVLKNLRVCPRKVFVDPSPPLEGKCQFCWQNFNFKPKTENNLAKARRFQPWPDNFFQLFQLSCFLEQANKHPLY